MGEKFTVNKMPPVKIDVTGADKIASVEVFLNGKSAKAFSGKSASGNLVYQPENLPTGPHIVFVKVKQADGNQAWSSPLWVNVQPTN
jgi:hypothetical protein